LLGAAALSAADLTTGQAARLVIGQETFTSQNNNSSDTILGAASGLAYAADTLFVADSNRVGASPTNHRVLLFQNLSTQLPGLTDELVYSRKCPVCVGQATTVLGQPDFTTTTENDAATASSLRLPTAVASDGVHLVVADTDHNRVLIWNRIPTTNDAPADVAVGQSDLATGTSLPNSQSPTAKSLRGPQGVWIQNGRLYVADTQNNRVMIWNKIPTANGTAADVVLGQPNFTTYVQPDLTQATLVAAANTMLNPVSVSSDGVRLFVSDLGYNRVLIWNSIPTSNGAPADVEIGQPDMTGSTANNAYTGTASTVTTDTTDYETPALCPTANGVDVNGKPTYPGFCNATLNFPRFALSTGTRLFVADGGNDRVLVYNTIPTTNAVSADLIIGQILGQSGEPLNQASDAADSLRTPMSLAWDGLNLYVSDTYNRRITVYSLAETSIPYGGVVNAASLAIYASANVTIGGTIQAGDSIAITIANCQYASGATQCNDGVTAVVSNVYTYPVATTDTLDAVVDALVTAINSSNNGAGDPYALAVADHASEQVVVNARAAGSNGNLISLTVTVTPPTTSTAATLTASASSATLSGGSDAASIAPGSLVTINATPGYTLSDNTVVADPNQDPAPTQLGGTEVYFNGIRAPLLYVSPKQINAQVPWEIDDTTSINAYVRTVRNDGRLTATTPVAASIVPANPGIFATQDGTATPPAIALHASSSATAVISVDGSVHAGDLVTVAIADSSYSYTVQSSDTLESIRDALVSQINGDPRVTATAAGVFTRIVLQARIEGPEGDGIQVTVSSNTGSSVVITALDSNTCCANVAGSPVTADNPARAGELIAVYATGLGVPALNDIIKPLIQTGMRYPIGAPVTQPQNIVGTPCCSVSSLIGGKTADIISATLLPGAAVGTFEVILHLNGGQPTDQSTQFWIAQSTYTSNIVTLPVVAAQ
jgi:uncharacterized protein (TIGR03437 family)